MALRVKAIVRPASVDIDILPAPDVPGGIALTDEYDAFIEVTSSTEDNAPRMAWQVYRGLEAMLTAPPAE